MILRIQLPDDAAGLQKLKYHRNGDGSHFVWCDIQNFAWHSALDTRVEMLDIRVTPAKENLEESQEDR